MATKDSQGQKSWVAWTAGLVVAGLMLGASPVEGTSGDWALTLYGAVFVESALVEAPFRLSETRPEYKLVALALTRRVVALDRWLAFEGEGQLVRHVEGSDTIELNALAAMRILAFPWDRLLDTSLAVGGGLSWASPISAFEQAHFQKTARLLPYVLGELEVAVPRTQHWRLVARVHHRSGLYGRFHGVKSGSNAVGVGVKRLF